MPNPSRPMPPSPAVLAPLPGVPALAREPLEQGVNFWVEDDVLDDPHALRERLLAQPRWNLGYPHRPETWPGRRLPDALGADALARVEARVRAATGCERLRVRSATDDHVLLDDGLRLESQVLPRGADKQRTARRLARFWLRTVTSLRVR
jgi:hypothetical protein